MKNKKIKFIFFFGVAALFVLGLVALSIWDELPKNPKGHDIILFLVWLIILDFTGALIYAILKKTIKKDKEQHSFLFYFVIGTAWILDGL
ncbi:hypothetical protein EFE32_09540 [Lactococcus lactis subsp. lactis]|uniref:hypothetical protein n=1 Tax=Lactococcus lactis TaxID=1358 RepID=UPI00223BD85F|nr:hypothetical protein [Lactococcus lactis]MCT0017056.1 hypothetical protein [Lactococcus lactis subsp. lactis]